MQATQGLRETVSYATVGRNVLLGGQVCFLVGVRGFLLLNLGKRTDSRYYWAGMFMTWHHCPHCRN
jgi:hypothetical protein